MVEVRQDFKNLIPPLSAEEYEQLEKNIIEEGCRDALVTWNGVILDGHNRYDICTKHGIDFDVYEMEFDSAEDAKDWMDRNQLGRRNLTPDQRRIIIGRRYNREKDRHGGDRKSEKSSGKFFHLKTAETIAGESGVNEKSVRNYAKDAEFFDGIQEKNPELAQKVWSGETTLKDVKKESKKEERETKIGEIKKSIEEENVKLPEGLFDVIAVDPPWNYGRAYDPESSRVANPYPEMTQSELLQLEIPGKDNSILFLWTTHAFIWDAKELMNKWGYTYKATIVWNKQKIGMGAWYRMQCEFCLFGIKGKPFFNNTTYRDIIEEPRREHSRKPEAFYDMVEATTTGRRLDYFAREKREGWEVYGSGELMA